MGCLVCGAESRAERETGYAGEGICPACASDGWIECADGTVDREAVPQADGDSRALDDVDGVPV